jgi:hypothetical protein
MQLPLSSNSLSVVVIVFTAYLLLNSARAIEIIGQISIVLISLISIATISDIEMMLRVAVHFIQLGGQHYYQHDD